MPRACSSAGVISDELFVAGAGAWAPSGCCKRLVRSSTRKADAIAAMPGLVTVHC